MGQYYVVVNLDKRQFLHPHTFDNGLKLMEFGNSAQSTLLGLTVLLASGNGRGGGDFCTDGVPPGLAELVGSWAGDRIAIVGDYDDDGKFFDQSGITEDEIATIRDAHLAKAETFNVYNLCSYGLFQDISPMVVELLLAGGEGVTFSPGIIRKTEPDRVKRLMKLLKRLPEWAKEGHPVLDPNAYVMGGK